MKVRQNLLFILIFPIFSIACDLPDGFNAVEKPIAVKFSDYQPTETGWTLLNLWAIWCLPCRAELPLLDTYQASNPPLNIDALNLNDDENAIKKLFTNLKITHLAIQSTEDTDVLIKVKAMGLPYTALLQDGKLIAAKSGILKETQSINHFIHCKQKEAP